jgi:hypothetical protein
MFSSPQCILPFARPTFGCNIYKGLSSLFNGIHSWFRGTLDSLRPFVLKFYVLRQSAALTGEQETPQKITHRDAVTL